ncbi:MAG: BamA/TamA family outer membrane protein, partial [Candidatus Neomarinimicrobiota bacterium]
LVGGLPWLFSSEDGRYSDENQLPIFDGNGPNLEGLKTIYFSQYLTPLRGTQLMEMDGDRALLVNLEYRFPFLIYYFPALRMLGQLGGVVFVDAGTAWNSLDETPRWQRVITYGWGPRFLLFGLPFQLDFAWPYKPLDGDKSRNWYLTIGTDF